MNSGITALEKKFNPWARSMTNVVSNNELIFLSGRRMRKLGKPCPPKPEEDAPFSPKELLWIGYRVQLAEEWFEQRRVAELLGAETPEIPG